MLLKGVQLLRNRWVEEAKRAVRGGALSVSLSDCGPDIVRTAWFTQVSYNNLPAFQ